jgi:thiamine pyrophosphokinase
VPAASRAAIVFAAASLEATPRLRARLGELADPYVVAADGGAATARSFGYTPDVVVGDLDSVGRASLAGLPVEAFPRDKDATDGQLAIERALQLQPTQLVLLGFLGGTRLDHALANVLLLARLDTAAVLLDEHNECSLVRPNATHRWHPEPGEIVSLLPLGGDAEGVRTSGLRWQLDGERLVFGNTRGVSNEPLAEEVTVSTTTGLLLVARHFPAS